MYDTINNFLLHDSKYLFFDIFHKNNKVILICPYYSKDIGYINNIDIEVNTVKLTIKDKIIQGGNECAIILIYEYLPDEPYNTFHVQYLGNKKEYTLFHKITNEKTHFLTLTTLFKDDYKLINIFYDYYINHGVDYFYMYYNGQLNADIVKLYDKPNIKLIEWNYDYWNKYVENEPRYHHAQHGQVHHAIYKYGKYESEYMIFNDLDEYLHIPNSTIKRYLLDNTYDAIGFRNCFSITLDKMIPTCFPKKFLRGEIMDYGNHSKNIIRLDLIKKIGLHKVYMKNTNIDNIMFHFCNWSKPTRKIGSCNLIGVDLESMLN